MLRYTVQNPDPSDKKAAAVGQRYLVATGPTAREASYNYGTFKFDPKIA
ncbi:MAG TPA: hypothetical protein VFS50_15140 [Meiothermus sp.]|nr:hypothetical protein [Meiothermus sp.]